MNTPKTRYTKSAGANIAYQVFGDQPRDLVIVNGWFSHVELGWENPAFTRFYERLASFARLILFDKRGTGMSDRVSADKLPTIEERMDDVRAVMDAVGSKRAAILGHSEGGPMAVVFAATYPERTSALIMFGSFAKLNIADSVIAKMGVTPEKFFSLLEERWSDGFPSLEYWAPSVASHPGAQERFARVMRMSATPTAAVSFGLMVLNTDTRHVLPSVRVPTLILHRADERIIGVSSARYLAEHIPGAKYVELPGIDHLPWIGDSNAIVMEIEKFLTGVKHDPEGDRVLSTVLFTDIVGSTEKAEKIGDDRWRELIESHHALVRLEIERFRGREINNAGDGFLACFDGPTRAVRCACTISKAVRPLGVEVRAGLHTGECEKIGDQVGGIAVHIGARVAACASAGEVLVSSTVKDLVAGSGLVFADRGVQSFKGVSGEWRLFAVEH